MPVLDRIPEKYKVRATVFTIGILLAAFIAMLVLYITKGNNCDSPPVGDEEDDGSVNAKDTQEQKAQRPPDTVAVDIAGPLRQELDERPLVGEMGAAAPAVETSAVVIRSYHDSPEQRQALRQFLEDWEPDTHHSLIVASAGGFPEHEFDLPQRVTVREYPDVQTSMGLWITAIHELQDDSVLQKYTHVVMMRGDMAGPWIPAWMRQGNWSRVPSSAWIEPLAGSLDRKRIVAGLRLQSGSLTLTDELLAVQTADVPTLQMWSFFKNTLQAEDPERVMRDLCQAVVAHNFEFSTTQELLQGASFVKARTDTSYHRLLTKLSASAFENESALFTPM